MDKIFLECCERMASKLIDKMKNAEQLAKEGLSKCRLDTEKSMDVHFSKALLQNFRFRFFYRFNNYSSKSAQFFV